jgi:hypothetical protein
MASTTVVKVKVEELTKYGFRANGRYVNFSKQFTDQAKVVPGAEFEAEFYVADSGKEYLNKVLNAVAKVDVSKVIAPASAVVDVERAKKFTPKFEKKADADKMSKAEWSAKDRSQLIGGLSHDAAAITAVMLTLQVYNNTDEVLKCYKQVLEGMIAIRADLV